jgi:hypothetical protein
MRDELKNLDYRVYRPTEDDCEYFLGVIRALAVAHLGAIRQETAKYHDDPDSVEAIADLEYYAFVDTVYLWEYGLWKLQGLLELIITTWFIPGGTKPLLGLKAKLDAMRLAGYTVPAQEYDELLEWAKLRNALSHAPPGPYRPVWLEEPDLLEYRDIIVRLCRLWRTEIGGHPDHFVE